jgi:hypothetical protein
MSTYDTLKDTASTRSTATILGALVILDAPGRTPEQNLVRAALIDVLEQRHPEVDAATSAWAESLSDPRSYVDVIVETVATLSI